MPRPPPELAAAEAEYRKWFWKMIGHGVFFALCVAAAVILRRLFQMPPALLSVALIVALLVFGGDIMKFLSSRRRLRELRDANDSS